MIVIIYGPAGGGKSWLAQKLLSLMVLWTNGVTVYTSQNPAPQVDDPTYTLEGKV
jgi:archaellum biogenesis ATPase FlaH